MTRTELLTADDVDRMTGGPEEISDDELLERAAAGDEEAFTALYRRRQGVVYRFALQMSGRRSVAEEVTQEVFLAVIRDAGRFDRLRGSALSYLYGIARNQVLRRLERDRPYVALEDEPESDAAHWRAAEDTLGELTRNETIESIRRAVLALPASFREVVVLCDLHEMSYAEAAGALGCAVGTVRSRLYRARALLLEKLKAKEGLRMNCREVEAMIADLARGVEADVRALDHVRVCGRCRELLAEEERLTAGLAAWAEAAGGEQAPPGMEAKLLDAFRESRAPARRGRRWIPAMAGGSIAAATLLVRMFTPAAPVAQVAPPPKAEVAHQSSPPPAPVAAARERIRLARRSPRRARRPAPVPAEIDFLPVAQGDGWTPLDGGRLVRVGLPRSALRVFGLPMVEERAQEQVQADVMLSNDGLVRAIRFVR